MQWNQDKQAYLSTFLYTVLCFRRHCGVLRCSFSIPANFRFNVRFIRPLDVARLERSPIYILAPARESLQELRCPPLSSFNFLVLWRSLSASSRRPASSKSHTKEITSFYFVYRHSISFLILICWELQQHIHIIQHSSSLQRWKTMVVSLSGKGSLGKIA
jgi:hypothetical protein